MIKRDHTKLICDISELSGLFLNVTDIETFLQKIVEMISEHMQSEVCSIYLFYEETEELVLVATKGLKPEAIGNVKLKLGEGLTGSAVKELRPICEKMASSNPAFRYFPEIGEEPYESFLAVPILRGHTRIGAIVIQNSQKNYFTEQDIQILRAISSQLATTIETTKLLMTLDKKEKRQKDAGLLWEKELRFIKGGVGAEGFALAPAMVLHMDSYLLDFQQGISDQSYTLEDFYGALESTEQQLKDLQGQIEEKLSDVASLIFTAQILMLKDKSFVDSIVDQIKHGVNPPAAIASVVTYYINRLDALPDQYLREKKHDIGDVGRRLLNSLCGKSESRGDYQDHIVIARGLYPSDILELSSSQVKGIILLSGGITSHLSILSRSLEIPLVITNEQLLLRLPAETPVLLDAEQGNIYINPSPTIVQPLLKRQTAKLCIEEGKESVDDITDTKDGTQVQLLANINLLCDVHTAQAFKAEGIGLYRTEFPFIVRSNFPSEEEQYVIYKKLVDGMSGKEITFRTLDIGGDKVLSYYDYGKEENPFLGMRSIRFSLRHKDVFKQQLRAILRAGVNADLRIMFPMISSVDEFLEAKEEVFKSIKDLQQEGIDCHDQPLLGMMVELPSVLEIIEELAKEADFFSIGTNDFIQYMLAVDRTNEKVADLYLPHHPSILRALKRIVDAAKVSEKDVTICGDMAHQERYLPYVLGIGVRKLSLDPHYIPKIQRTIQNINLKEAEKMARHALNQTRISSIEKIIRNL